MRIASMVLLTPGGRPTLAATAGDPLTVKVVVAAAAAFDDVDVTVSFYDLERGTLLAECTSRNRAERLTVAPGETTIDFEIPRLLFAPGVYTVGATVTSASCDRPLAWRFGRTTLYVEGNESRRGSFLLPYRCHVSTPASPVLS
jgi:hypothetical protein